MATAPPPPPPPLPASCGNQPSITSSPPPCPGYAAVPFIKTPVQETNPSAETQLVIEGAPAPPQLPLQNVPESLPSQEREDKPSDEEEKHGPVQETNPASQMTEQQDEAAVQMDPVRVD